MKLSDIEFEDHPNKGYGFDRRAKVFFDNGYGASIVTGSAAYTNNESPYELAILKGDDGESSITYETPLTDDVLGYLDDAAVNSYLDKIAALPSS